MSGGMEDRNLNGKLIVDYLSPLDRIVRNTITPNNLKNTLLVNSKLSNVFQLIES